VERKIKGTVVIIENTTVSDYIQISSSNLQSRLTPYADEIIWDHQCGFQRINELLIRYSAFIRQRRKKWENKGTVYQLLTV
jgi:hypothetical protein